MQGGDEPPGREMREPVADGIGLVAIGHRQRADDMAGIERDMGAGGGWASDDPLAAGEEESQIWQCHYCRKVISVWLSLSS